MNSFSKYKGEVSLFYRKSKGEVSRSYKFDYVVNNTSYQIFHFVNDVKSLFIEIFLNITQIKKMRKLPFMIDITCMRILLPSINAAMES